MLHSSKSSTLVAAPGNPAADARQTAFRPPQMCRARRDSADSGPTSRGEKCLFRERGHSERASERRLSHSPSERRLSSIYTACVTTSGILTDNRDRMEVKAASCVSAGRLRSPFASLRSSFQHSPSFWASRCGQLLRPPVPDVESNTALGIGVLDATPACQRSLGHEEVWEGTSDPTHPDA